MSWEVEYTDQFRAWYDGLSEGEQDAIVEIVGALEERGPGLGRPEVDRIASSRHHNMKELRPRRALRILFAFDPSRTAILLIGGNKAGRWRAWYAEMVPVADALYDEYLREIASEEGR